MNYLEFLKTKLAEPADPSWIDKAISLLKKSTEDNQTLQYVAILEKHRGLISKMNQASLTLFMQQLASGSEKEALITFINTQATADDIINIIKAQAADVIRAKAQLDLQIAEAKETAWAVIKEITVLGAKHLLPLLLALVL